MPRARCRAIRRGHLTRRKISRNFAFLLIFREISVPISRRTAGPACRSHRNAPGSAPRSSAGPPDKAECTEKTSNVLAEQIRTRKRGAARLCKAAVPGRDLTAVSRHSAEPLYNAECNKNISTSQMSHISTTCARFKENMSGPLCLVVMSPPRSRCDDHGCSRLRTSQPLGWAMCGRGGSWLSGALGTSNRRIQKHMFP